MSRLGLLVLLITCQVAFEGVAAEEGNSNRVRYRLPTTVKPTHYDLTLEPNLEKFTFTGSETVQLKVLEDTYTLVLNKKELNLSNIVVQDPVEKKNLSVGKEQYDEVEELLTIPLETKLTKGKNYVLSMDFVGTLNDQKRGFYRSRYFTENYEVRYIATTHFEPTGARLAFPCWDEPAFKATFQLTLIHSNETSAISNTNPEGEDKLEGNKRVTKFKKTPDMSTYLVAFVVSDYGKVNTSDDSFRVWTKPHALDQAKYALDAGENLMKKLEEYTGIGYGVSTLGKMDQISIKDFSAGAMENWGLVTYRESALLYEEGVTTLRSKQSITTVIAHEFAHQWFGNLVSPKWWKYIWLNEGFADYLQYFIAHMWKPEWRLDETFVVDNTQGNAFIADAVKTVRAMNHDVSTPAEISKLFDSIAYQKSGAVIRMMSHILTDDVFRAGLKNYLETYKFNVTESYNLFQVLQNESNWKWSDVTFDQVMDAWVNKSGYPVLTVKRKDNGKLELTQQRFLADGTTDDTKWWIPLTYTTSSKADFKQTKPENWLGPNEASKEIDESAKKDDWVIFNILQSGYYRVNYDEDNWKKLDKALKDDHNVIVPVNRAQLVDDVLNLARANHVKYSTALSLTNYLNKETDFVVWSTAFRNLNFLQNMLRTSKHYNVFKLYVKYITKSVVDDVLFKLEEDKQKEDTDLKKLLRVNLVKWTCRAGLDKCKSFAEEEFKAWLNNSAQYQLDVNLKNNIICAGLRNANADTWNKTEAILKDIRDEDERKSMFALLACPDSTEILKNFINSTLKEGSVLSFSSAVQAVVSEHNEGVDLAIDMLKSEQKRIKQLPNGKDIITSTVQAIANGITKNSQYVELSRFVGRQGLNAEDLQSVVEKASSNMDWVDAYGAEVEKWLSENQHVFSSATSVTFASLLVALSLFITRFY
ncbi:aminopeptidase N-like [Megachile rotundata]|uniref:aminopeptidase N-like n=1 Tax=Megachile rotundata TaxID=143995 RepID=UPI003FD52602